MRNTDANMETDVELAQQKTALSPALRWHLFFLVMGYRQPMNITEIMAFQSQFGETVYYVCPRCHITMEREYMAYCDRCGQRLGWKNHKKARVIYPR